jgi:Flp pilus assembly protein TadG
MILRKIRQLRRDEKGQAVMAFGLAMPIVLSAVGLSVDYSTWFNQKDKLQAVADAAAVAAARELIGSGSITTKSLTAKSVALAYVDANIPGKTRGVEIDPTRLKVKVSIQDKGRTTFSELFGITDVNLRANGTASVGTDDDARACVLALDPDAKAGVTITGSAKFRMKECLIWSNATSTQSITVGGTATVEVSRMCSAGKTVFNGSANTVTGTYQEDCDQMADPLEAWAGPASSKPCIKNYSVVSGGDVTLSPGTYCGGLSVSAKGRIILTQGIYVIDGGPLKLTANSTITGTDVGIYLTGSKADAQISGQSTVSLEAPDTGLMKGIVLASDRNQTGNLATKITGGATVDLVGTVYLPAQAFEWAGNSKTSDPSSITQVIAKTVGLYGTTDIVYETDFEAANYDPIETTVRMAYVSE